MANSLQSRSLLFSNRHEARAILPLATDPIESILSALGLPAYEAVLLVVGGAGHLDPALRAELEQVLGRGVARAAIALNAVLLDGGTRSGVMELVGTGVAANGYKTSLIGVAPLGRLRMPDAPAEGREADSGAEGGSDLAELDPNHSHFVLAEGNSWGDETATLFGLAAEMSKPVLILVIGGGAIARTEILQAVRRGFPIIVVKGSGGLADDITAAVERKNSLGEDPVMAEIIEDGRLQFHALTDPVMGMYRLIERQLGDDKVLMQAWETYAEYDVNAGIQQRSSDRLQISTIVLGIVGTLLAITKGYIPATATGWEKVFEILLIVIPILLTLLITAGNRFRQSNKWLMLRSAAEAIKREIYRYRTGVKFYQDHPQQVLALRLEAITQHVMTTEVNTAQLRSYDRKNGIPPAGVCGMGPGRDDGMSSISPERYIKIRLDDQVNYYKRQARHMERQLRRLSWWVFGIGGAGTLLSALHFQVWIAFTTILAAGITSFMGYRQTENTLKKYNQTFTDLLNIRAWWNALSADEQSSPDHIDLLVEHTEGVLGLELDGWLQRMQNAQADLRKQQGTKTEAVNENGEGDH